MSSLTKQAYHEIEELIVTLQLEPGRVTTEVELAELTGKGRTPVREALQTLVYENLVRILPRRAIIITELNPLVQLRLHEVRREMESLIARLAAKRRTESQKRAFLEIAAGMKTAAEKDDFDIFMKYDHPLHRLAAESCGNEFAMQFSYSMLGMTRRFWYRYGKEFAHLPDMATAHSNIAYHIALGNCDEASISSERNMQLAEDFIRSTVSDTV